MDIGLQACSYVAARVYSPAGILLAGLGKLPIRRFLIADRAIPLDNHRLPVLLAVLFEGNF